MLIVDGVSLSVGGRRILEDVSFEVQAGEVVSLIGPNGAGKSTILGVIAGDIKPDSGSVLLKNKRVGEYSYLELARLRALLLQKTQVAFSYLVHEVVAMGRTPWRGTERAHEDDAVIEQMMARTHTEMMANRDVGRVAANGAPVQVCTEERLSRVYQHPIEVLEHPVTKRPLVLPRR